VPPKAIIFDIGRVIVRVNVGRLHDSLAGVLPSGSNAAPTGQLSSEAIWQTLGSDPRWTDWQEGRMSPEEWHKHLTGRLRVTIGFTEFCHAWNHSLDPQLILNESLFETLGKQHKLALLSNTDPLHSTYMESDFSFTRYFPVRIYSWRIGSAKPSPAIYLAALEALGVPATDALYIDDVAEYAEAAQQLGLDAIQFESPAQLHKELSLRSLLKS
jgi:HAD superfamily hydrolase (TIGR01509 family)